MIKRALYFIGRSDEEEVSRALVNKFPSLKFIDGARWGSTEPPLAKGIHCCQSHTTYLWASDVVPVLPTAELPVAMQLNGHRYAGPTSGPVIQFDRCNEKDGQLDAGQLSAYLEDTKSPLGQVINRIIAFLKRRYACKLDCYSLSTGKLLNENIGGYLVGLSTQTDHSSHVRLVPAFGRDDFFVPRR